MAEHDTYRCLPIAEVFDSLQGEGRFVGTPMKFIRLAGCSVGEPETPAQLGTFPILKTANPAWLCHTYDGRSFFCDTDFKFREWQNFSNLLDDTWQEHICLTGGEPLMHGEKLQRFIAEALERDIQVHVETSGTIDIYLPSPHVWVSMSPKLTYLDSMIQRADEIKLLVDEHFDIGLVPPEIRAHPLVYVQPINDEMMVRKDNFDRCMGVLRIMPLWHMSVQTHKLLGLR